MAGVSIVKVKESDDGIRLNRWFLREYPSLSLSRLQKLLRTKQIKVDGKKADLNAESKDKKIYGFSLLCSKKGEENVIAATAELIDDKTVAVDVPHGVGDVKELRYLWADSPAPVNLYSRNSLPAAPFRIIQG